MTFTKYLLFKWQEGRQCYYHFHWYRNLAGEVIIEPLWSLYMDENWIKDYHVDFRFS